MSLWMNIDDFGIADAPKQTRGFLARVARRFRAADVAALESATPHTDAASYDGPERRRGRERRGIARKSPDRRRG